MIHPRRSALTRGHLPAFDWFTCLLVIGLAIVGLLLIFNASHADAYLQFGDRFRYLKLQSLWLVLGVVAMLATALIPPRWLYHASPYLMGLVLLLLVAVLIPQVGAKYQGARRWLTLGSVVIQPSELAKISLVLYLPALLTKRRSLTPVLTVLGATVGLIILEPDLGTALIVSAVGLGLIFLAGVKSTHLLALVGFTSLAVTLLIFVSPYRLNRLKTFLDPTTDPQGTSYHLRQILIALGSGGLSGTGIGQSRQKFAYLPEATTDSIFAVIAEETGFLGAFGLILIFLTLSLRLISQVVRLTDPYLRLLGAGVALWLTTQTLVNLASMVSLIPLTGVPLPFLSYGGSALLSTLVGLGLYLNASRFLPLKAV